VSSRADDASFERVVNCPARGIGAKSLDVIREQAKAAEARPCGPAAARVSQRGASGPKAETAVNGFLKAGRPAASDIAGLELHEQVDHVINNSGLSNTTRKKRPIAARHASRT
jgi:DNA helicase-2/ATP-dependent DNA helicase PcrA